MIFGSDLYSVNNESYITDQNGDIKMPINIIGHIKNPGTYLVYDGIDLMSAISIAGGYNQGANLESISIYRVDGQNIKINLKKVLKNNLSINNLVLLKPNDTIYINQKALSRFLTTSNLPYTILGLINIGITLSRD